MTKYIIEVKPLSRVEENRNKIKFHLGNKLKGEILAISIVLGIISTTIILTQIC